MSAPRIRIAPDDPSTFPEGRIDPARVDATTEAEIAAQEREDEAEALQDMARYRRRVRRRSRAQMWNKCVRNVGNPAPSAPEKSK